MMKFTLQPCRRCLPSALFVLVVLVAQLTEAQPGGRFGGRRGGERESGGESGSGGERGGGYGRGGYGRGGGERDGQSGGYGRGGYGRGGGERDGQSGGYGRGGYGRGGDEGRGPMPPSSSSGSGSSPSPSTSRTKTGDSTSVQGFGNKEKAPQAPGFSVPLEAPGGDLQARYDKKVLDKVDKEVMPTYDRDKDSFLSTEESKESDWDPPFSDSDIDKDGRLSRFELYERYAKKFNLPPKTAAAYTSSGGREIRWYVI